MIVDDIDAFIERIAEAVVGKIDERDKINLIAEAVLERLKEMEADTPEARHILESTSSSVDAKASVGIQGMVRDNPLPADTLGRTGLQQSRKEGKGHEQ